MVEEYLRVGWELLLQHTHSSTLVQVGMHPLMTSMVKLCPAVLHAAYISLHW